MWVRNRWLKRISDAKKWSRFFQEHSDCTHYHKYHKVVRACCTNPLLNLPAYTLMVSLYQYNFIICKEFHLKHHFGALTKHFHDHYSCTVKKYHGVKKIGIDDRVHTKKNKKQKKHKKFTLVVFRTNSTAPLELIYRKDVWFIMTLPLCHALVMNLGCTKLKKTQFLKKDPKG